MNAADGRVSNSSLQNQITQIATRLDRMAEDIQAIKTMLERMDERIRTLENSDAAAHPLLQSRVDAAWRVIDVHEAKINELTATVSELRQANRLLAWLSGIIGSTVIVWIVTQILGVIR
jgi:chromosome segregation ATPase